MIPIDRKELNRQEPDMVLNKDSNDEQQSKIKEKDNSQEISSKAIPDDQLSSTENHTENDEYVI